EEIGRGWLDLGIRPGDLVLLCLPSGITLLEHWFGALNVGAVPALLAPNTPSARVRELARLMGARAVGAVRLPADAIGAAPSATVGGIQIGIAPPECPPAADPGE